MLRADSEAGRNTVTCSRDAWTNALTGVGISYECYRRGLARVFRQTGSLYAHDPIELDEHPDRVDRAAVATDADLVAEETQPGLIDP